MSDENYPLADIYYHLKLVPKKCTIKRYNNDIDIYLKGENLAAFISDVFPLFSVKIVNTNSEGFML